MKNLLSKIKIFYDSIDLKNLKNYNFISGIIVNTSMFKENSITEYKNFLTENQEYIIGLPVIFQMFVNNEDRHLLEQATLVKSLGENIYVEIPIIKKNGTSNLEIIKKMCEQNININITAVFSIKHVKGLYNVLKNFNNKVIVSICCEKLMEIGANPSLIIFGVIQELSCLKNVEICWTGCKSKLCIRDAIGHGCNIISIPDKILFSLDKEDTTIEECTQKYIIDYYNDKL